MRDEREAGLGRPDDVSIPFFAYGLLKPGELAHEAILGPHVDRTELAQMEGVTLRYRDGMPLLDSAPGSVVHGTVVWLSDADAGYRAVGEFEPRHHYRWEIREAASSESGETVTNVLFGRSSRSGSSKEPFDSWHAAQDPAFAFGPHVVSGLARELVADPFPVWPGDSPLLWDRFFRIQAAYLLLWSLVERYTALAFGPATEPMSRIKQLDQDPSFRDAVLAAGTEAGQHVIDSRNPQKTYVIRADGSHAAHFWYQVRSNLSHRGKSAFQDGQLVQRALVELHDTFRVLLLQKLPALDPIWRELEPQAVARGWLIGGNGPDLC